MTTDQHAGSGAVILVGCRFGAGQGSQCGKSQEAMWLGTAPWASTPTVRGEAESLPRQVRRAVPKAGAGQVTLSATGGSLGYERHRKVLVGHLHDVLW